METQVRTSAGASDNRAGGGVDAPLATDGPDPLPHPLASAIAAASDAAHTKVRLPRFMDALSSPAGESLSGSLGKPWGPACLSARGGDRGSRRQGRRDVDLDELSGVAELEDAQQRARGREGRTDRRAGQRGPGEHEVGPLGRGDVDDRADDV